MANAGRERPWPEEEQISVKRRKLLSADQDRLASEWFASTTNWSPDDSMQSASTFIDSPASIRQSTPCDAEALHALDQHILGIAQQAAGNPASQRLCPVLSSSNLYTPLAQRIILSSQQQAPKLQVQQLSIYPDPELLPAVHLAHHHPHHHRLRLPASGVKRLRLDSYSIASQLASGQVAGFQSFSTYASSRQQEALITNPALPPSQLELASNALLSCYRPLDPLTGYQATSLPSGLAPVPRHCFHPASVHCHPTTSQPAAIRLDALLAQSKCLQSLPVRASPALIVQRPLSSPASVLEQWSFALGLLQDTVQLALHMFTRAQCQILEKHAEENALQRGMSLLGCLWVAAKHEECRFGLPGAQKMAALIAQGVHGGVRSCTINSAELYVLNLLRWQPLKGWDDLHFVKGKSRDLQEISELRWLSSGI